MFTGARILIVGLIELETGDFGATPGRTLRLCDGGMVDWPARGMFVGIDAEYGTIGSVDPAGDAIGDEAAGGRMTINVPTVAAAVALAQAEMQGKPLRFWMGEVDFATGLLIGTPEKLFEGQVDTLTLSLSANERNVVIEYVDAGERLFSVREGNVLTTRFHQTAWPGELGFDFCTGAGIQVPWGVSGPPRGSTNIGSGGGGGGGILGGILASVSK